MKRSLRSWLWRIPLDREFDEEIELHIEMRTRELIDEGIDPAEARAMAIRKMGDLDAFKRTCVDLGRKRTRRSCSSARSTSTPTTATPRNCARS
ncbi:MAG: permease prefix domain 1-containing protein [Acidimicrobiia bacterium]